MRSIFVQKKMKLCLGLCLLILSVLAAGCAGRHATQFQAMPPADAVVPAPSPPTLLSPKKRADHEIRSAQERGKEAENEDSLESDNYRQNMQLLINAFQSQGFSVVWPHGSDENAIGVIVPDGVFGAWTLKQKKAIAGVIADEFT